MAIDERLVINIQGRMYVRYGGVLKEALNTGLFSLRAELIQAPTAENGNTAICKAIAKFKRDSEIHEFEELGDASPANCAKMVSNALIRMAATRAKGRALRDAVGHGESLAEELCDLTPGPPDPLERPQDNPSKVFKDNFCNHPDCGLELTQGQVKVSKARFGKSLCPQHQRTEGGAN